MDIPLLVTTLLILLILGVSLIAVPSLSRPTVPLGVSVPSARADDPVVRAAVARYRIAVGVLLVIALAGALATMRWPLAFAWWTLGFCAAGMVAFVVCRRPIRRAKAEQGWYDGVPVRLAATLTRADPAPVSWPLHLFAVALPLLSALVVAVAYPSLPDPLPTHYTAGGVPDAWEPKSWTAALMLPAIGTAMVLLLLLVAWLLSRHVDPQPMDGHPDAARGVRLGQSRALQRMLGLLNVLSAGLLADVAIVPVLNLTPDAVGALVWGGVTLTLLPAVWLIVRSVRLQREAKRTPSASGPESPDDDRLWIGGMFYYNPADPSVVVPRRAGVGYDLNLGHPAGVVFLVVTALLVLGLTVFALVQG